MVILVLPSAIEFGLGGARGTSSGGFPAATTITIRVVRTGPGEASVVGVADGPGEVIEVLVNGTVAAVGIVSWIGEYWILGVPVIDNAIVQTRIGSTLSPEQQVPAYVPQRVGPPGFIYAEGWRLKRNDTPIQLFGVDEQTAFIFALIASGLWGPQDPGAWGRNQLFPSGPDTKIPNVVDAETHWREFFRYFLHYNEVAGSPEHPKVNVLRIWVADDTWYPEGTYLAWKSDPAKFWDVFDRMVYWARRAGVYLVPILGHFASVKDNRFFDSSDIRYAHRIELVRAIMDRYEGESQIAMWDLWNEPDVDNDVYWASVGGITGFRAWAAQYLADVKAHSYNHPLTIGIGGWSLFPGVPGFGWQYHFFWNDIPGLDVSHHHTYGTAEDQYLIDWETDFHRALGIPHYEGEFGYNLWPGPSPLGYGYWPWFTERTGSAGWPAISTMVFVDNGKGTYADYPYLGPLPAYPPENGTGPNVGPTASFVHSPSSPQAGESVQFDASASTDDRGIVQYAWDFGDGQSAQGRVLTHAYSNAGAFDVALTVRDADGANDTARTTVSVDSAPDRTAPARVVDLAAASTEPDRVTLQWTAPGDDGTTGRAAMYDLRYTTQGPMDDTTFPSATPLAVPTPGPAEVTETWTIAGLFPGTRYWFGVRAADEVPNWSSLSNVLTVDTPGTVTNAPPTASFFYSPPNPRVGDVVQFNASASTDDRGIVTYLWDFGDGQAGSGSVETHAYSVAGAFNVTLTVLDEETADDTAKAWVVVDATPASDESPPAAVADLAVTSVGPDRITLQWTAPGDDQTVGRAAAYDIRYTALGALNETNFGFATAAAASAPAPSGSAETLTITGLSPDTQYWFGLRSADEVPNWSPLSNTVGSATSRPPALDTTPPLVGFSGLANGSEVFGDVLVSAWATDDSSVSSVSFLVDGVLEAVITTSPYDWTWRSTGVADGVHRLTAVAEDASGNRADADVIVRSIQGANPRVHFVLWDPDQLQLVIVFTKPMNRASVEANIQLEPNSGHTIVWEDDQRMVLALSGPTGTGREWRVTITGQATDTDGIAMSEGFTVALAPGASLTSSPLLWTVTVLGLVLGLIGASAGLWRARRRLTKLRIAASGLLDLSDLLEDPTASAETVSRP